MGPLSTSQTSSGSLCEYIGHECLKAHPRSLQPAAGYRSRFRASVGGMRTDPEDPQRQSARTRADQLELPPPNDGVET